MHSERSFGFEGTPKEMIDNLWKFLKHERVEQHLKILQNKSFWIKPDFNFNAVMKYISEKVEDLMTELHDNEITEESLKISSEMYIYWVAKANFNGNLWDEVIFIKARFTSVARNAGATTCFI